MKTYVEEIRYISGTSGLLSKAVSFSSREEQAFSECYLFCFSNNIKTNLPPSVAGKRYISLLPQWSYSVLPLFDEKSVNCRPEAKTQLGLNLLWRSILGFFNTHSFSQNMYTWWDRIFWAEAQSRNQNVDIASLYKLWISAIFDLMTQAKLNSLPCSPASWFWTHH